MSFVTKEWKDRLAEFAGRRKLTNVSTGEETTVDVSRAEGEVSQAGDAFSAANMNDLEQRIKDGFDKVDTNLSGYIQPILDWENKVDISTLTTYTPPKHGHIFLRGILSADGGAIQIYNEYIDLCDVGRHTGTGVSLNTPVTKGLEYNITSLYLSSIKGTFVPYK